MKNRVLLAASIALVGGGVISAKPAQAFPIVQSTSGKCIQPINGSTNPGDGTQLVLSSSNCNADNPLSDFQRTADGALRHTRSGKCIHPLGGSAQPPNNTPLVLWSYCAASGYPQLQFRAAVNNSLQQVSSNKCIHPRGGSATPDDGTPILLHDGCGEARLAFNTANQVSANDPYLPFDPGVTLKVTQGYNTTLSHGSRGNNYYWASTYAVDFATSGNPYASARASRIGTVVSAGLNNFGFGNLVKIRYRDGRIGYYAHLSRIYVQVGQEVAGGQIVGTIGQSGNASGIHLHYEERDSNDQNSLPLSFKDVDANRFWGVQNSSQWFDVTSRNPDNRR
jgi:hypothetical protein